MLAHNIRSYHRPIRIEDALDLAGRGVVPLAGGTRLLAQPSEVPNVLDLGALELRTIEVQDGDLVLGALTTLQDVIDSAPTYAGSAGLLPAACRAQSVSRLIRGMATLGGESVYGAHDSEVVAALLALNGVYRVVSREGEIEVPALRFLKAPAEDLRGGALVSGIVIPGAPGGAALERVAVTTSAPAIVAVAATIAFAGDRCVRARIALTGLAGRPARAVDAEARLEGTDAGSDAVERAVQKILARDDFRDDAHAPASYRRTVAGVLVRRALRRAVDQARAGRAVPVPRLWHKPQQRPPTALPNFTSGRLELRVNGKPVWGEAESRMSLLQFLRARGLFGVKHGCETGECGACAVLIDGRPTAACLTLALRAAGHHVQTVEGLGTPDHLHPVQQAFVETGAIQCGFCTPAMELCAAALLEAIPDPTEAEARDALAGCLCRCTGYVKPVEAVLLAARERK